ncbi:unnamed protein product, partial [Polarella glacialis]
AATDLSLRAQLLHLFQEDFEFQLRDNPEFASQAGFHQYSANLQELSPQAFEHRLEHNAEVLGELQKLGLYGSEKSQSDLSLGELTAAELLYAELFAAAVEGESRGIQAGCHLMPLNSVGAGGGVHENFLELLDWMQFESEGDVQNYIARLMAFPHQVDDFCKLLAYGASGMRGVAASKSMLRRVPERLRELLEGDELAKTLREPVKDKACLSSELSEQLQQATVNCFRPGLEKLLDFLTEFYEERARSEPGCLSVRNGAEVYAECLRFHTTTRKSAQEIHELGLAEVARIESRLQKEVLDALGFKGTFQEFAASSKADASNFYTSEGELLNDYRRLVEEISEVLPRFFSHLPRSKLEVVPKRSGPAAYYFSGTPDGKRPGRFYVNVTRLSDRPRYNMTSLALHEGFPGHHLQGSIALENEALPNFLRYIEDRRYEYNAARRPLYTGYLEGWALYAEHLGEEMGLYKTPLDLFGRLSMEMMRAVRLVVDTGIHAFGWSVERAASYMEEKTGMPAAECLEECHRYAAWPGQACAYKVGQLALEDIRSRAEAALGESFQLAAFHDMLLNSGPMPLDILERRADAWISEHRR